MSRHRAIAQALACPLRYAAEPGPDMEAFHRAMLGDQYYHDMPRLAYADWLEEHGSPRSGGLSHGQARQIAEALRSEGVEVDGLPEDA